jgi:hypothetical protein
MAFRFYDLNGTRVLACEPEGKILRTDKDVVELIGEALGQGAGLVVIPVERLDADFFRLRTGLAGALLQKFVTYGVRVAILGDISRFLAESSALRDLVFESNRGRQIWFVATEEELRSRQLSS